MDREKRENAAIVITADAKIREPWERPKLERLAAQYADTGVNVGGDLSSRS